MRLSVVIASSNGDELLKRAVQSIEVQGHGPEIVIVDNLSDTPITKNVGMQFSSFRIVRSERMNSAAISRSIGIARRRLLARRGRRQPVG